MRSIEDFSEILQTSKLLAPLTWMRVGGPAQYFLEPRSLDELAQVTACCHENQIPVHILGNGSNLLIRDEGVSGAVIQMTAPEFLKIDIEGTRVSSGAGALLSNLISRSVEAELAGLDSLVGIPGTVGGALHGNAGGRIGDIGQFVRSVDVLTAKGERFTRTEDELSFGYRESSINELVILSGTFQLQRDDPHEIVQRMRKNWIVKKSAQPLTSQSAGCIFKNPRGMSTGSLIEQSGLKGARVGNAEISDRHANFVVTHEGATSDDVLRLIDLVRSKVAEQFGVDLELEIEIW
ncbi:MAG: UDP-N-acetylenolpyruvoylglucosamine reductase [Planctomycetaceae bacterium]|nr:UDP-N-acetylenolpyruvoylglucosamine reductase [Planctomycetaceae bacterium]